MKDRGLPNEDIRKLKHILEIRRNNLSGYMAPLIKADKPSESRCEVCGCRITKTETVGEAGHNPNCEVREERYTGQVGDLAPTPPNAKPDRKLVSGGDER